MFRLQVSSPVQASYATESVDSAAPLDCMLGSLTAEMNRQGVNTTQKGCCTACDKAIVGQVITALGKTWHPEHFTCTHCSQELGTRNFFERDGRPYCEPDYHNLFSPRCAYCNGPILDVRDNVTLYYPLREGSLMLMRFSEMCDSPGEDMAHGTLFLCSMRQTVRRGGIPRARRSPVLSRRLLRHVRSQVRRMQSAHNGKLRVCPINSMAFQLLRMQGK